MKVCGRNNTVISILLTIAIIVASISVTYAVYNNLVVGAKNTIIESGTLILTLDESIGNGINMVNTVPMSDNVALTKVPYRFSLENTGTTSANYKISLIDDAIAIANDNCSTYLLSRSIVKYALKKNNVLGEPTMLNALIDNTLDSGIINSNSIINYELYLWVDSTANNSTMNKHFHTKLSINSGQINGPGL